MMYLILATTDGRGVGQTISDTWPSEINDMLFTPDRPPFELGDNKWRFSNSNFTIDALRVDNG